MVFADEIVYLGVRPHSNTLLVIPPFTTVTVNPINYTLRFIGLAWRGIGLITCIAYIFIHYWDVVDDDVSEIVFVNNTKGFVNHVGNVNLRCY